MTDHADTVRGSFEMWAMPDPDYLARCEAALAYFTALEQENADLRSRVEELEAVVIVLAESQHRVGRHATWRPAGAVQDWHECGMDGCRSAALALHPQPTKSE